MGNEKKRSKKSTERKVQCKQRIFNKKNLINIEYLHKRTKKKEKILITPTPISYTQFRALKLDQCKKKNERKKEKPIKAYFNSLLFPTLSLTHPQFWLSYQRGSIEYSKHCFLPPQWRAPEKVVNIGKKKKKKNPWMKSAGEFMFSFPDQPQTAQRRQPQTWRRFLPRDIPRNFKNSSYSFIHGHIILPVNQTATLSRGMKLDVRQGSRQQGLMVL